MTTYTINIATRDEKLAFDGRTTYTHLCRVELGDIFEARARERFAIIAPRFPFPDFSVEMYSTPNVTHTQVASNDTSKAIALDPKARKTAAKATVLQPAKLRAARKMIETKKSKVASAFKRARRPDGKYNLVAKK